MAPSSFKKVPLIKAFVPQTTQANTPQTIYSNESFVRRSVLAEFSLFVCFVRSQKSRNASDLIR